MNLCVLSYLLFNVSSSDKPLGPIGPYVRLYVMMIE